MSNSQGLQQNAASSNLAPISHDKQYPSPSQNPMMPGGYHAYAPGGAPPPSGQPHPPPHGHGQPGANPGGHPSPQPPPPPPSGYHIKSMQPGNPGPHQHAPMGNQGPPQNMNQSAIPHRHTHHVRGMYPPPPPPPPPPHAMMHGNSHHHHHHHNPSGSQQSQHYPPPPPPPPNNGIPPPNMHRMHHRPIHNPHMLGAPSQPGPQGMPPNMPPPNMPPPNMAPPNMPPGMGQKMPPHLHNNPPPPPPPPPHHHHHHMHHPPPHVPHQPPHPQHNQPHPQSHNNQPPHVENENSPPMMLMGGGNPNEKVPFLEMCDRMKQQYNSLIGVNMNIKSDMEKLISEKNEANKLNTFHYEMACSLNLELHKYLDTLKKIHSLSNQLISMVSSKQKPFVMNIIEIATTIINDGNSVLNQTAPYLPVNPETSANFNNIHYPNRAPNPQNLNIPPQNLPPQNNEVVMEEEYVPYHNRHVENNIMDYEDDEYAHVDNNAYKRHSLNPASHHYQVVHSPGANYQNHPAKMLKPSSRYLPQYNNNANNNNNTNTNNNNNASNVKQGSNKISPVNNPYQNPVARSEIIPVSTYEHFPAAASNNSVIHVDDADERYYTEMPNEMDNYALNNNSLPQNIVKDKNAPSLEIYEVIPHGDVVCATSFLGLDRAITGGRGLVKIWDLTKKITNGGVNDRPPYHHQLNNSASASDTSVKPIGSFSCLSDRYIRSIKVVPETAFIVVAGESKTFGMWDLNEDQPRIIVEMENPSTACYNLVTCKTNNMVENRMTCYTCLSDGQVILWDLLACKQVCTIAAHDDGCSSAAYCYSNRLLWTGSLDNTVKAWDLRNPKVAVDVVNLKSQVFSLDCSEDGNTLIAGLENCKVQVMKTDTVICKFDENTRLMEEMRGLNAEEAGMSEAANEDKDEVMMPEEESVNLQKNEEEKTTENERLDKNSETISDDDDDEEYDGEDNMTSTNSKSGSRVVKRSKRTVASLNAEEPKKTRSGNTLTVKGSVPTRFSELNDGLMAGYELNIHRGSVLSVKMSPKNDWFISTGKDSVINCVRMPSGPGLCSYKDTSSVLCCDISDDGRYILTGSGDRKSVIYHLVNMKEYEES